MQRIGRRLARTGQHAGQWTAGRRLAAASLLSLRFRLLAHATGRPCALAPADLPSPPAAHPHNCLETKYLAANAADVHLECPTNSGASCPSPPAAHTHNCLETENLAMPALKPCILQYRLLTFILNVQCVLGKQHAFQAHALLIQAGQRSSTLSAHGFCWFSAALGT